MVILQGQAEAYYQDSEGKLALSLALTVAGRGTSFSNTVHPAPQHKH